MLFFEFSLLFSLKYFVIIKKSITFALAFAKNGVCPSGAAKREESVL
jgi:hypothetical protein